jgi:hypothetical protein
VTYQEEKGENQVDGDGLEITTMLLGQDLPYPTCGMVSQGRMHVNGTLLLGGRVVMVCHQALQAQTTRGLCV